MESNSELPETENISTDENYLLGKDELDRALPQHVVKIFVATWNMNGKDPPEDLRDLLFPESVGETPEVIVVGTQESNSERDAWEVALQEIIGPSHVLYHSNSFGAIHLAIFFRRDLIWYCSVADDASYAVRPFVQNVFRTKGAVGVSFYLFGTTFLFMTCHLSAHEDRVDVRRKELKRIVKNLELPNDVPVGVSSRYVTERYDYVFLCGDLNFRLEYPRSAVIKWITTSHFPLSLIPQSTEEWDQLKPVFKRSKALRQFQEGPLLFPPTYKFDPGTQRYDTSHKQRTPSYTDRILFKGRLPEHKIECLAYNSIPSFCTSDHKPVWGLYTAKIRPGSDNIPLNAGYIKDRCRDVYLEAMKKRTLKIQKQRRNSVAAAFFSSSARFVLEQ